MMAIDWVGEIKPKGTYVLHIVLQTDLDLAVGKLGNVSLEKGHYCYVGSALGHTATSLPYRLLRHCITSSGREKSMYSDLFTQLRQYQFIPPTYRPVKNIHWHIDYLVEKTEIDITDILIITRRKCRENDIVALLEMLDFQQPVRGLGSTDSTEFSHFFRFPTQEDWNRVTALIYLV
jgi:Uri superfamily endonuclease